MDLRRLSHFIALAEEGRFALAAQRMHLSQAAFSRSIQTLEARVGLRLFDRSARGARLTPAGQVVLQRARALLSDSRSLERDIALLQQGDLGTLSIGVAPIPAAVLLPALLCQLHLHSPRLVCQVRLGSLLQLLELLDAQALDFCLGDPRLLPKNSRYDMLSVGRQSGALYVRADHPLARKKTITADQIRQYGVALISMTSALRDSVARACGFGSASSLPVVVECDDMGTLVHMARHTDVLALLPDTVACPAGLATLAWPHGGAQPLFADLHAIWLRGRTRAPSAIKAIALARQLGRQAPAG